MPLTERERHDAYEALRGAFGEQTDAVIQLLRPDHEKLVTKDDLGVATADLHTEMADLGAGLRTEMADLGVELRTEMADLGADLRTEMADVRTELRTGLAGVRTEIADLRTELDTDMAALRVDFATELNAAFAAQTRTLIIGLVSAVLLIALSDIVSVLAG
jgi:hypothetical protein